MESLVKQKTLENFYANKKVFVTGHTGFKGSWLITWLHLLKANIKGYALATDNYKNIYNTISSRVFHQSIIADIRNKEKLREEILSFQPDFIFHLAAQPLVRRSYEIPSETFEVNAIGTANLLEAVWGLRNKCTTLVITTDKVYENKEWDNSYRESDRLGGFDPYSASKACTEIVVSSFHQSFFNKENFNKHQKSLATVRAGNVIGGGDWNKDRIIPDIINNLQTGKNIPVRNPNAVRPWQHVLEPLGGYLLLAALLDHDSRSLSDSYNFGPQEQDHLTVKEVVELAISSWGDGQWINQSGNEKLHEAGILKLNINLAEKELNWKPKLNSEQAIRWTIDWYKQSKEKLYDFTVDQINNYQSL